MSHIRGSCRGGRGCVVLGRSSIWRGSSLRCCRTSRRRRRLETQSPSRRRITLSVQELAYVFCFFSHTSFFHVKICEHLTTDKHNKRRLQSASFCNMESRYQRPNKTPTIHKNILIYSLGNNKSPTSSRFFSYCNNLVYRRPKFDTFQVNTCFPLR